MPRSSWTACPRSKWPGPGASRSPSTPTRMRPGRLGYFAGWTRDQPSRSRTSDLGARTRPCRGSRRGDLVSAALDARGGRRVGGAILLECLGLTMESDRGGAYRYLQKQCAKRRSGISSGPAQSFSNAPAGLWSCFSMRRRYLLTRQSGESAFPLGLRGRPLPESPAARCFFSSSPQGHPLGFFRCRYGRPAPEIPAPRLPTSCLALERCCILRTRQFY